MKIQQQESLIPCSLLERRVMMINNVFVIYCPNDYYSNKNDMKILKYIRWSDMTRHENWPTLGNPFHLPNSMYLSFTTGADPKGTVSRDFFTLVFFIKHLLLVSLDTPRKDFKFFRIFEELFKFVIDSPVYSQPGSRDSWCIHHRRVVTPRCIHYRGVETPR